MSADTDQIEAITTCWIDNEWNELENKFPLGVIVRLKHADRSLHAAAWLTKLLFKDATGKEDVADSGDDGSDDGVEKVTHAGLDRIDVENARVAIEELLARAQASLVYIRQNKNGFLDR
jgi:hypothetical protein